MKKFIKMAILLVINFPYLYAYNSEVNKIIDASYIDTHQKKIFDYRIKYTNKTLSLNFKKGNVISYKEDNLGRVGFSEQNILGTLTINKTANNRGKEHNEFFNELSTIYGQSINIVSCVNRSSNLILSLILQYGNSSRNLPQYVEYKPKIYKVSKGSFESTGEKGNVLNFSDDAYNNIIIDDPESNKKPYPYYNEEKILERLYETGTCDKEITQKANIEVLVDDKWIPQEESWNIKKESKLYTINLKKQPLYKTPPEKTKMYLIKGDKVEILEEKDDWLHILYKGKKDIKAWIPKSAVE